VTTDVARASSPVTLLRFDAVQRAAHWANAVLFGVLIVTAIPLYVGSLLGVTFPRHTIQLVHLVAGLVLPAPVIVAMLGPWGRRMRADLRRCAEWTRGEISWLRRRGQVALRLDKFNPGQKANAVFTGAAIVVLFASGYILQWFRFFPESWRTGATLTHDVFAFAITFAILAHVVLALSHPVSLRSMITGEVPDDWAVRHARSWWDEEHDEAPREGTRGTTRRG
jgi:formate dehydrogenase subunit gamma